jgi:hypothetical protein
MTYTGGKELNAFRLGTAFTGYAGSYIQAMHTRQGKAAGTRPRSCQTSNAVIRSAVPSNMYGPKCPCWPASSGAHCYRFG